MEQVDYGNHAVAWTNVSRSRGCLICVFAGSTYVNESISSVYVNENWLGINKLFSEYISLSCFKSIGNWFVTHIWKDWYFIDRSMYLGIGWVNRAWSLLKWSCCLVDYLCIPCKPQLFSAFHKFWLIMHFVTPLIPSYKVSVNVTLFDE